uniref:Legumain n=1 Tax=Astyanax mexicanus TaxID=7994 RepID=A0A8B9H7W2_ASTMX
MANRQQFSEMVIYIESCNSGSMLEHLPSNVQVYGVSAADPNNPSCACYLDKVRHAYIADEFSAHWLLHCKMSDLTRTTFQNQFQYLRSQVKQSTPCQYGNNILCQRFISDFLGCPDSRTREAHARTAHTFKPTHLTASHEVPMVLLNMKIEKERDPTRKRALQRDYDNRQQKRDRIERTMRTIASRARPEQTLRAGGSFEGPSPMTHLHNMKEVAEHFRLTFRELHGEQEDVTFLLHHIHVFDDLLRARAEVHRIKGAITHVYSTQRF